MKLSKGRKHFFLRWEQKAHMSGIFYKYFVSSADWLLIYSGVLWEVTEGFCLFCFVFFFKLGYMGEKYLNLLNNLLPFAKPDITCQLPCMKYILFARDLGAYHSVGSTSFEKTKQKSSTWYSCFWNIRNGVVLKRKWLWEIVDVFDLLSFLTAFWNGFWVILPRSLLAVDSFSVALISSFSLILFFTECQLACCTQSKYW